MPRLKPEKPHGSDVFDPTLPRTRLRPSDLVTGEGIAREQRRLYVEARRGAIPLGDACRLAYLLQTMVKTLELVTLERRIAALENADTAQPSRGA